MHAQELLFVSARRSVISHVKMFLTVSHFKNDSRSPTVHLPFERTGMPFERLELSVLKNSSSIRMVRAIRSRKLISHSNGSIYPFEKNHQPFEQLELSIQEVHQPFEWLKLSVREIHQLFEWLKLSVRENHQPFEWLKLSVPEIHQPFEHLELSVQERNNQFFGSHSNKTRRQNNSPCFVKWCMPLWLHYRNSHHVSVLCLSSFNFK